MSKKYMVTDFGVTPNSSEFQTKAIQHIFDMCYEKGGTVECQRDGSTDTLSFGVIGVSREPSP